MTGRVWLGYSQPSCLPPTLPFPPCDGHVHLERVGCAPCGEAALDERPRVIVGHVSSVQLWMCPAPVDVEGARHLGVLILGPRHRRRTNAEVPSFTTSSEEPRVSIDLPFADAWTTPEERSPPSRPSADPFEEVEGEGAVGLVADGCAAGVRPIDRHVHQFSTITHNSAHHLNRHEINKLLVIRIVSEYKHWAFDVGGSNLGLVVRVGRLAMLMCIHHLHQFICNDDGRAGGAEGNDRSSLSSHPIPTMGLSAIESGRYRRTFIVPVIIRFVIDFS
jgi:hypothetical protein